jgi:pilus assembly protein CpaE
MVIDNDADDRKAAMAMLAAHGVEAAYAGRHGIDALQATAQLHPDILFVAVGEPLARTMQTVEFAREANPGCAIVAYAENPDAELARRVMRSMVVDLLRAPLTKKDFAVAMERAIVALERQAALAELANGGRGGIFAVVGQKGGIGKTTIATNLASVLASRTEESVLIIDLDTRFGDVALAMDAGAGFTAANAARGLNSLSRDSFRSLLERHESGAYVLPAPEHPREWVDVDPEDVRELIAFASELFDYVVLDTPGTLDEMVAIAIEEATRIVAVTSLDLTSIKNTNLLLAYLEGHGVAREQVVLTVSHNLDQNIVSAQDVSNLLGKVVDYEVPFSRAIARASSLGRPIAFASPESDQAHAYAGLASLVSGTTITMPDPAARRGWLARIGRQKAQAGPIKPVSAPNERVLAGSR